MRRLGVRRSSRERTTGPREWERCCWLAFCEIRLRGDLDMDLGERGRVGERLDRVRAAVRLLHVGGLRRLVQS